MTGYPGIQTPVLTMGSSMSCQTGQCESTVATSLIDIDPRDACMTWTLDNGTIVMQNFANKDEASTSDF